VWGRCTFTPFGSRPCLGAVRIYDPRTVHGGSLVGAVHIQGMEAAPAWARCTFIVRGSWREVRGGSCVDAVHVQELGWWNRRVLRTQVSEVFRVGMVHTHAIWNSLTLGRSTHL
jgi:hypothetical protein